VLVEGDSDRIAFEMLQPIADERLEHINVSFHPFDNNARILKERIAQVRGEGVPFAVVFDADKLAREPEFSFLSSLEVKLFFLSRELEGCFPIWIFCKALNSLLKEEATSERDIRPHDEEPRYLLVERLIEHKRPDIHMPSKLDLTKKMCEICLGLGYVPPSLWEVFTWVKTVAGNQLKAFDNTVLEELDGGLSLHKRALSTFGLHGGVALVDSGCIHILDLDNRKLHRLSSLADSQAPMWSPDGKQLVYTHYAGAQRRIRVISLDAGTDREIQSTAVRMEDDACWTRDGRHIVFTSMQVPGGTEPRIYMERADGTQRRKMTDIWGRYPHVRMKDDLIVFVGLGDGFASCLYTCNPSSGETIKIVDLRDPCFTPRWSPDGKQIAVKCGDADHTEIVIVEYRSRAVRRLTHTEGVVSNPSWSADGQLVMYSGRRGYDTARRLWVISVDGSRCLPLTEGLEPQTSLDWYSSNSVKYAELLRRVDWIRRIAAENANRIAESGVRAAQQADAPVPAWFGPWTKKEELVNILAEGSLKAYLEIQKRENTWSSRFRKGLGWFVGGLILAIVGVLVAWAMGLIGFK